MPRIEGKLCADVFFFSVEMGTKFPLRWYIWYFVLGKTGRKDLLKFGWSYYSPRPKSFLEVDSVSTFLFFPMMRESPSPNTPDIPFRFWPHTCRYIFSTTMCVCVCLLAASELSFFFLTLVYAAFFSGGPDGEVMMMYLKFPSLSAQSSRPLCVRKEPGGADEMLFGMEKRSRSF